MVSDLGKRVRERREELGLTQSELARRAKISQPVINDIESGAQQSTANRRQTGFLKEGFDPMRADQNDRDGERCADQRRPQQRDDRNDRFEPLFSIDLPISFNEDVIAIPIG